MLLRTRIPLIGLAVLAVTIAGISFVAYELSRVQGRAAVDDVLRQEAAGFRVALPDLLIELGGEPDDADFLEAAGRYLSLNPGSPRHLMLVTIGRDRLATSDGPESLRQLYADEMLPVGRPGALMSVDTARGAVRILNTPVLRADGSTVGTVTVIGPLDAVLDDARDTLLRVVFAGAIGLAIGGAALAAATRRSLAPLHHVATTARLTTRLDESRVPEAVRSDEVGLLARELNGMLDRLDEHRTRRDQLLASVSHELRTPVAVATGHLEVFEQTVDGDPEATRVASVVRAELGRLTRIIDDVSAAARDEDTRIEIGPVFVPDLFDALHHRLEGLQVDHVTIEPPPSVVIDADEQRLLQSLLNLVNNAIEHNPAGTSVAITAEHSTPHTDLSVTDNGTGVAPDILPNVFEPFVTTRTTGAGRSSGLGLSVVKALTERQGGTVRLDTASHGTRVTLRFPNPVAIPDADEP